MNVELRFFANFREAVGQKTLDRECADGTTVGKLLASLQEEYEGLDGRLLDEEGALQPMVSVMKNGRDVVHLDGPSTALEEGDTVSVFPPVAGGRR